MKRALALLFLVLIVWASAERGWHWWGSDLREMVRDAQRDLSGRDGKMDEARAYLAFLESGEGKAAYEAATHRVEAVRRPFPDAGELQRQSGYPSRTYVVESKAAKTKFSAYYDFISARGQWRWQDGEGHIEGEFVDGDRFVLHCPEGAEYLTAQQRDTILRLLGAKGGPAHVAFVRAHDGRAVWDRLFAEYKARRGS